MELDWYFEEEALLTDTGTLFNYEIVNSNIKYFDLYIVNQTGPLLVSKPLKYCIDFAENHYREQVKKQ